MGLPPRPTGALARSLGRYEYVCEIARSYFGPLWAAKPTSGEGEGLAAAVRRVSTAEIGAEAVDLVCEGAWWGMEVEHRGVARVVDVAVGEAEVGIVTDYFEGEALRSLLRQAGIKRKPFNEAAALRIGKDLLLALEAVHGAGVNLGDDEPFVHGGVNPDTIFVGTDGEVRVVDVGLATVVSTLQAFATHADRAAYLPPELFTEGAHPDARTDVFSVGVLLWEMLSNRRLFVGASHEAIAQKVKAAPIPRLDGLKTPGADPVSEATADILARALERDADARYQTVGEMLAAIDGSGVVLGSVGDSGQLVAELAEVSIGPRRRAIAKATGVEERVPLSSRFRTQRPEQKRSGAAWKAQAPPVASPPAPPVASPPAPPVASPPAPPVASPPAPPVASPPAPQVASPPPASTEQAPPASAEPDTVPRANPGAGRAAAPPPKRTMLGMPSPLAPAGTPSPPPLPAGTPGPPPLPAGTPSPPPLPAGTPSPPPLPAGTTAGAPHPPPPKRTMLGMPSPIVAPPGFGSDEASTQPSVRDIPVSRVDPPSEPPPGVDADRASLDAISIHDVEPIDSSDAPTLPPKPVPPPPAFLMGEPGTLPTGTPKPEVDAWVKALTTPVDDEDGVDQEPAISAPIPEGPVSSPHAARAPAPDAGPAPGAPDPMDQAFARAREADAPSDSGTAADAAEAVVVPERTRRLRKVVAAVVGGLALLAILAIVLGRTKPSEDPSSAAPTPAPPEPAAESPTAAAAAEPPAPAPAPEPAAPDVAPPEPEKAEPPDPEKVEPEKAEPAPAAAPAPSPAPRAAPPPRSAPAPKKPRRKFTPDDI